MKMKIDIQKENLAGKSVMTIVEKILLDELGSMQIDGRVKIGAFTNGVRESGFFIRKSEVNRSFYYKTGITFFVCKHRSNDDIRVTWSNAHTWDLVADEEYQKQSEYFEYNQERKCAEFIVKKLRSEK